MLAAVDLVMLMIPNRLNEAEVVPTRAVVDMVAASFAGAANLVAAIWPEGAQVALVIAQGMG